MSLFGSLFGSHFGSLFGSVFASMGGGGGGGARLIQPGALSPLVTLTRSQVGAVSTAISGGGGGTWWQEFGADAPRFGGSANRLMVGGQRTNLNTRSRLVGGTGWTLNNITAGAITGPDGAGATANRLDEGTNNSTHFVAGPNISFVSGVSYPASFIVKAGTCTTCQIAYASGPFGLNAFQNFDLTGSGALGTGGASISNARIVSLGSGWFWISAVAVATATTTSAAAVLGMTNSASAVRSPTYPGTSRTMDVFWSWVENAAPFPSSATLATSEPNASTRGQDTLTSPFAALTTTGLFSTLISFNLPFAAVGSDQTILDVHDTTLDNRIRLRNPAGTTDIVLGRTIGGVNVDATVLGSFTPNNPAKVLIASDTSTLFGCLNGGTVQSVAGVPAGTSVHQLGNNSAGTTPAFVEIGYVDVLPYATAPAAIPAATLAHPY